MNYKKVISISFQFILLNVCHHDETVFGVPELSLQSSSLLYSAPVNVRTNSVKS